MPDQRDPRPIPEGEIRVETPDGVLWANQSVRSNIYERQGCAAPMPDPWKTKRQKD